jgi:hypothetical protein
MSLFLCLAPFAISGQDGKLKERRPYPNLPIDPPFQHTTAVPRRSVSLEASVGSGATLQDTQVTAVAATSITDAEKTVIRTVSIAAQMNTAGTTLTPSPSAQPGSSRYPTDVCWGLTGSRSCFKVVTDFNHCYTVTGSMIDLNGDDGRSLTFQRCLCVDVAGAVYKKYDQRSPSLLLWHNANLKTASSSTSEMMFTTTYRTVLGA